MRKLYLLLTLTMLGVSGTAAQSDTTKITIEELFLLAQHNNLNIRAANSAAQEANYAAEHAKRTTLPTIDAALGLSLNSDGTITDRNFTHRINAPIPLVGNNFAVEAAYVIFAGGSINNTINAAKTLHERTMLEAQRTQQNIRFTIAANYIELCRMRNQLKVFDSNILQTEQTLKTMRAKVKHGAALNSDITRYELQLLNLNYAKIQIENTIFIINSQLIHMVGAAKNTIIMANDDFSMKIDTLSMEIYAENSAINVKIAENNIKHAKYAQKIALSTKYPVVAAFAGGYLNAPIMIEIPVENKNFNYFAAGISIKYNISNFYTNKHKISAAAISVRKSEEEKEAAIEQSTLAMQEARVRYHESFALLDTKLKSMQLADENYNIIKQKYDNDLALITELLDAAAQKLEAELQMISARYNILYNYYKIKYTADVL